MTCNPNALIWDTKLKRWIQDNNYWECVFAKQLPKPPITTIAPTPTPTPTPTIISSIITNPSGIILDDMFFQVQPEISYPPPPAKCNLTSLIWDSKLNRYVHDNNYWACILSGELTIAQESERPDIEAAIEVIYPEPETPPEPTNPIEAVEYGLWELGLLNYSSNPPENAILFENPFANFNISNLLDSFNNFLGVPNIDWSKIKIYAIVAIVLVVLGLIGYGLASTAVKTKVRYS